MTMSMYERQAEAWYHHENGPEAPRFHALGAPERARVCEHVAKLLHGERARDKGSAGDDAIWLGRFRTLAVEPPELMRDIPIEGITEVSHDVLWDSFELAATDARIVLFGNANVGDLPKCNLAIGFQLPSSRWMVVTGWHLMVGGFDNRYAAAADYLLGNSTATIHIGDRPLATRRLAELAHGPVPLNLVIPTRQTYRVEVDLFKDAQARLADLFLRDGKIPDARCWICLEGWTRRSAV